MVQDLEARLLLPGVHSQINGQNIPVSQSFVDEVSFFVKNISSQNGSRPLEPAFVNQKTPFEKLVRILATEYPYAVLVGDAGVGKTMIIDFVTDILQGNVPMEEVKKMVPELAPEFQKIIERARSFEHRHYLLLPNLGDPMNVGTISYTGAAEFEKDSVVAMAFCRDIGTILGSYAAANRRNIKLSLTKEEFSQYVRSRIGEFYVKLYEEVIKYTDPIERGPFGIKKRKYSDPDFALVTVEPPIQMDRPSTIKGKWEFVQKPSRGKRKGIDLKRYKTADTSGYSSESRNVDKGELEKGLGNNLVYKASEPLVSNLLWELGVLDVSSLTEESKFRVFRETFLDYTENVVRPMAEEYIAGRVVSQQSMLTELKTQSGAYFAQQRFSAKTIEDIAGRVQQIKDRYADSGVSDNLVRWMDSVVNYFETEKVALENAVQRMWIKIKEIETTKPPRINERKEGGKGRKSTKTEEAPEQQINYSDVTFQLRHGKHDMGIHQIMQVNAFRDTSSSNGVTITKVREFSEDSLFGTFREHDDKVPPHMTFATLGTFFKGGILVFPDSFSDFIGAIAGNSDGRNGTSARSMREQFLDYLQTGNLTLVRGGISYNLNAPRILIGSDNSDPFLTMRGLFFRNEVGLRDRITTIYVPFVADNTPEARRGTLLVLYRAIEGFNRRSSGQNGTLPIAITDEAADMLLRANAIASDRIELLVYRGFTKLVEDICAYTRMRKETVITPDLLRQKTLDDLLPGFFLRIDQSTMDYGGYKDKPDTQIGAVNGVAVSLAFGGRRTGSYATIQSYFVPSLDRLPPNRSRIELIDIESRLAEETMIKGFELAQDYIKMFIDNLRRKGKVLGTDEGWQLKTQFRDNWGEIGGPSGSLAITLSMLSALSREPLYKNRFVTGTLEPSDGSVGDVGGTYYKGLVPTRISQLMGLNGSSDPMYLLIPAGNLREITAGMLFDPFGMEQRVAILPVTSVGQAYHLMTCGPKITQQHWQQSLEMGNKVLEGVKERILTAHK